MKIKNLFVVLALTAAAGTAVVSARQTPGLSSPQPTGRELFVNNCASCHGLSGRGDGPAGTAFKVPPSDLTRLAARNGGMFPSMRAHRIIDGREVGAHGNPDMPVWGAVFKRGSGLADDAVSQRIEAIVKYLESIQERPGH